VLTKESGIPLLGGKRKNEGEYRQRKGIFGEVWGGNKLGLPVDAALGGMTKRKSQNSSVGLESAPFTGAKKRGKEKEKNQSFIFLKDQTKL